MRPNHMLRIPVALLIIALIVGMLSLEIHVRAQDSTPEGNTSSNRIVYLEGSDYRSSVFVHDLDTNTTQDLLGSSYSVQDLTSMPNGEMAFVSGGELYRWDGTNAVDITPPNTLQVFSLIGSVDGQLAFVLLNDDTESYTDFKLYVWEDGEYRGLGSVSRYPVVTWSADGRLAFESNHDGNDEIYVWAEGELTNISNSPSADAHPTWSPDGRLAYVSSRDGAAEIYVWDGTTTVNVSQSDAWDEYPVWSQDGRLAFVSSINGSRTLFVWDGTTLIDLGQVDGHYLTWSADGQLAFTSFRDGNREIYVWANGVITNLSQSTGAEWQPTWSADGYLAFTSYHNNLGELFVWDGGALTSIVQSATDLAWSVDGQLAFSSAGDIFIWDGSTITNITDTPDRYEHHPRWLA
jgi:hypothetical protein